MLTCEQLLDNQEQNSLPKSSCFSPKSIFTFPILVSFSHNSRIHYPMGSCFHPIEDYLHQEYLVFIVVKKCSTESICFLAKSTIPYQIVVSFHPRVQLLTQEQFFFSPKSRISYQEQLFFPPRVDYIAYEYFFFN